MNSLLFALFIYLREEKFQGTLWKYENLKVNVTQRSPWNSISVTFSFERRVKTSLLILLVDWLIRVDCSPHSLLSSKLWDVKVFVSLISYYSLPFVDCSLMLWLLWIILSMTCVVNYFLLHGKLMMIVKLMIRCSWS